LTIPCWPKDRAVEDTRFLMGKSREAERNGHPELAEEYAQLAFMFKHRLPDCRTEADLVTTPFSKEETIEGKLPSDDSMSGDLSYHLLAARLDPSTHIGNVMRDLVKRPGMEKAEDDGEDEDLVEAYIKVGKVQDPMILARKAEATGDRWGEDRYLSPETMYDNPADPERLYTIADTVYYEHDRPKARFKRGGIVDAAGFAQVQDIGAVKAKRPPVISEPVVVEPITVKIDRETKATPPKTVKPARKTKAPDLRQKSAVPSAAKIAGCIIKTRKLANKLRDYDPKAKKALEVQAETLKELRRIEKTTDDNKELDRVQEEIPRVMREIKQLKKMDPETIHDDYDTLKAKCPGLEVDYHDTLGEHSNVIRFHYLANSTEAQSLVVRAEARELYEEFLK